MWRRRTCEETAILSCVLGKVGRGIQLEAVVVNLRNLCAFRALRPWLSLWYNSTVGKRLKKDACEVMQLIGRAHEDVTALVPSFL